MNFETKNLFPIVIAAVTLLLLSYMSTDLFKIFKIRISNEEIVTTNLITKFEKSIPLSSITKIEKEKVRFRNSRGNISDGHFISIIKFSNNKLVISPDSFENYEELINYIKHKLQNRNVA